MQQLIQGAQMLLYAENQIISKALSWDQIISSFLSWATTAFCRSPLQLTNLFVKHSSNSQHTRNIPNSYIPETQIEHAPIQSSHSQQVSSFPQPHNTRTICSSILNSRIWAQPSGKLLNSLSFSSSPMCLSNLHIHATS